MAVRCIFDTETGELVEFNTQREPTDNELVAYWGSISYPSNGLVYDVSTNTVRERTNEEAHNDNVIINDRICTVYPRLQVIRPRHVTKLMFVNNPDCPYLDASSTIRLPAGYWSLQGTLTLLGLHSVKYCSITWCINGKAAYVKTFGGLVFHHYGVYSLEFSHIIHVEHDDSKIDVWISCDKYVRLTYDPTHNVITFYYLMS